LAYPLGVGREIEVVELGRFAKQANKLWNKAERAEFIDFIARNPLAGDVVQGTGGMRKVRWTEARRGRGKRGGTRVMYYYLARDFTLYLLALYSKGDAADLTTRQRNELTQLARQLKR